MDKVSQPVDSGLPQEFLDARHCSHGENDELCSKAAPVSLCYADGCTDPLLANSLRNPFFMLSEVSLELSGDMSATQEHEKNNDRNT